MLVQKHLLKILIYCDQHRNAMKHVIVEDHRKIKTCFVARPDNGLINYDAMNTTNNKQWPST
jgi:hypothetical protein